MGTNSRVVRARVTRWGFLPQVEVVAHDLMNLFETFLGVELHVNGYLQCRRVADRLDRHRRGRLDVATNFFHVAEFEIISDLMRQDPIRPLNILPSMRTHTQDRALAAE